MSDNLLIFKFYSYFIFNFRPEQSKNIHVCLLDILEQIIEEAEHLPQDCINTILDNYKQVKNLLIIPLSIIDFNWLIRNNKYIYI